jgi:hypothetical protein
VRLIIQYTALYGFLLVLVSGIRTAGKYPVLRMNTGTMCISARKQLLCSKVDVDAVEQRHMANSGARGTKDWNLRTEVDWYSTLIRASCQLSTLP